MTDQQEFSKPQTQNHHKQRLEHAFAWQVWTVPQNGTMLGSQMPVYRQKGWKGVLRWKWCCFVC